MMYARIIMMVFFPIFAIAQAPQKINFQSILRNSSGEVVGNGSVGLKISILSGSIDGSSVYSETHVKTTDASGLISIQIGNGTVISGIFANIDWGGASHFIKLEVDFSGGSNYVVLGTQELMSVPYAMYASKTDTSALNLTSRLATKLNVTDTVSLSNRINANANTNSGSSDTSLLNLTSRLATKLNVTDTASLSNRINAKLTKTDTASLSNRIDLKLTKTDTSSLSNRIDLKLTKTDTASLSNRIDLKLTKTDTASLSNRIDGKLTKTDTASLSNRIDLKLIKTDTASLSNRIDAKLNRSDFPGGSTLGNILYWNGTNWANLAPGQNGQALILVNGIPSWSTISTTVTDIDGNTYNTVQIGSQVWMIENLKTSRYRNGGLIPNVTDNTAWSNSTIGAWSYYNNAEANNAIYGKLYNWYTTLGDTLCPTGWGVPTDAEWTTLTNYLGGESVAGGKMKTIGTTYWNSPNTGATNESGFSVLPGGYRSYDDGSFYSIRFNAVFWSATEGGSHYSSAWFRYLGDASGSVLRFNNDKSLGASVRCLRD